MAPNDTAIEDEESDASASEETLESITEELPQELKEELTDQSDEIAGLVATVLLGEGGDPDHAQMLQSELRDLLFELMDNNEIITTREVILALWSELNYIVERFEAAREEGAQAEEEDSLDTGNSLVTDGGNKTTEAPNDETNRTADRMFQ